MSDVCKDKDGLLRMFESMARCRCSCFSIIVIGHCEVFDYLNRNFGKCSPNQIAECIIMAFDDLTTNSVTIIV